MSTERVEWPFPKLGLFTELDSAHIPPDALTICQNAYYLTPNVLVGRGGIDLAYHPAQAAGHEVRRMYWWYETDQLIWADEDRRLFKANTYIGQTHQLVRSFASFGTDDDPLLYVAENRGGEDHTIHTYDNTTYAILVGTNIPLVEKIMVRHQRLWGTHCDAYPSRVYWSDVNDATNWAGNAAQGGWLDVAPGEDGEIVDWVEYGGVLYIFKRHNVYAVTGWNDDTYEAHQVSRIDHFRGGTAQDVKTGVLYAGLHSVSPLGTRWGTTESNLTRHVQTDMTDFLGETDAEAAYSEQLNCYMLCNGTNTLWVSSLSNRPDVWSTFLMPFNCVQVYQGKVLCFGSDNGEIWYYKDYAYQDHESTIATKTAAASFKASRSQSRCRSRTGAASIARSLSHSKLSRSRLRSHSASRRRSVSHSKLYRSRSRSRSASKQAFGSGSQSRSRCHSESGARSRGEAKLVLSAGRSRSKSASKSRTKSVSKSAQRTLSPSRSRSQWAFHSESASRSKSMSRSIIDERGYVVRLKTGDWDMGTKLRQKDVRYIEGRINAAENATATVMLYRNRSALPVQSYSLGALARNLIRTRMQNADTVAYEVRYSRLTGKPMFAGLSMWTTFMESKEL